MREQLTKQDVQKIEEEIEYRKLVLRKELIESVKEARVSSIMQQKKKRIKMKVASGIWREC